MLSDREFIDQATLDKPAREAQAIHYRFRLARLGGVRPPARRLRAVARSLLWTPAPPTRRTTLLARSRRLAFVARGFLAAGLAGELSTEPLARLRALGLVASDASFDALFAARACFGACARTSSWRVRPHFWGVRQSLIHDKSLRAASGDANYGAPRCEYRLLATLISTYEWATAEL